MTSSGRGSTSHHSLRPSSLACGGHGPTMIIFFKDWQVFWLVGYYFGGLICTAISISRDPVAPRFSGIIVSVSGFNHGLLYLHPASGVLLFNGNDSCFLLWIAFPFELQPAALTASVLVHNQLLMTHLCQEVCLVIECYSETQKRPKRRYLHQRRH